MSSSTESSPGSEPDRPSDSRPVGAVLAGGESRRMGTAKALMSLAGKPLLDRVIESIANQVSSLVIVGGSADLAKQRGLAHAVDRPAGGRGPLAGLLAAMDHVGDISSCSDFIFLTATDMPFLPPDLVTRLVEAARNDLPVLPRYGGKLQPLAALWPRRMRKELEAGLNDRSVASMKDLYESAGFIEVSYEDAPDDPFFNVNTPDDLELARRRLGPSG